MTTQLIEQNDKPIYDEKINAYLRSLAEGKTREEIAEIEGNKNWKSVDMYFRRRNFQWDGHKQTYVPKIPKSTEWLKTDTSKAGQVTALLAKPNTTPKSAANRLGFKDYREMAQYMQTKGYAWNAETNNYIKQIGLVEEDSPSEDGATVSSTQLEKQEVRAALSHIATDDLARYLPLLELLSKNKDRLLDLILPESKVGVIPRYVVPGIGTTKTIHMMNTIIQLVSDFSREKNITQREIFEVALIEFFKKYSYEHEMERLLGK